jgi:AcrR family transcriptional regulator
VSEEASGRLPAGRHGLPSDVVAANQRGRLIDAFARCVAQKGYRATTVADITSLAAVSRNVFYEQLGGKEECFIAAYDVINAHLQALMSAAAEPHGEGPEQLIARLRAGLAYFAAEPDLARLFLVEPMGAGPKMTSHYEATIHALATGLQRLKTSAKDRPAPATSSDEVLLLGAISLVVRRINLGEASELEGLVPELAQILLSSDLDEDEIREIAEKVGSEAG